MEITADELKAKMGSGTRVTLVDVREPWEWDLCHLEGARHIPMGEIPVRYLELDPEEEVVVYCHVGQRSAMVVQFLRQQGYQEAYQAFVERLKGEQRVDVRFDVYRVPIEVEGHPTKGPASAEVTLVEFSDFECPYCSAVSPTLKQIADKYGDKVRRVFRQFPLMQIHPNALKAAEASLCASEKGKFWEMHDLLFQEPKQLAIDDLKKKGASLGLNATEFDACLDSGSQWERIRKDLTDGAKAGVSGTPGIFINGRFLNGAQPYEEIAKIVDDEIRRSAKK